MLRERRPTNQNGLTHKEGSLMAASRLRVYYGPEQAASAPATIPLRDQVTLPLGEVLPLLVEAASSRRAWIDDFADDNISISSDLHEVLLAYRHFRRPGA
jgi:hypothetical protein